jgi:transcriptional regulator with PAS, ATPase and Fis domain
MSIDAGSIPDSLFESELFGYIRGAFTDARTDKPGRIEIASGGTLFLDEVGNLPLHLQSKLLSVLERREIVRLGASRPIPVDIRLICATNANLYQLCEDGKFREDLLFRINTIQLELPPLRERTEDIPGLVEYFLEMFTRKHDRPGLKVSRHALQQLQKYPWKGNIRELRNLVEKAVLLAEHPVLEPADLTPGGGQRHPGQEDAGFNLAKQEKLLILKALSTCSHKMQAARELGINRTTLYNKMKKYGIEPL